MNRRARIVLVIVGLLLLAYLARQWRLSNRESSQDKNIVAASRKYGVDPALIKAIIWRESRFDPDARGSKGEIGLMQIMPDTASDWASAQRLRSPFEFSLRAPARNIDCGAWYLAKLLRRYPNADNPVPYALADYNAGRGNVLKWLKGSAFTNSAVFIEEIGFPATRQYVRDVMGRRSRYANQFETARK